MVKRNYNLLKHVLPLKAFAKPAALAAALLAVLIAIVSGMQQYNPNTIKMDPY